MLAARGEPPGTATYPRHGPRPAPSAALAEPQPGRRGGDHRGRCGGVAAAWRAGDAPARARCCAVGRACAAACGGGRAACGEGAAAAAAGAASAQAGSPAAGGAEATRAARGRGAAGEPAAVGRAAARAACGPARPVAGCRPGARRVRDRRWLRPNVNPAGWGSGCPPAAVRVHFAPSATARLGLSTSTVCISSIPQLAGAHDGSSAPQACTSSITFPRERRHGRTAPSPRPTDTHSPTQRG